jgi:hypothetical protein
MSRLAKWCAVVILVAIVGVALAPALSSGQGGQSALLPPEANFRGKSLEEWTVLWAEWRAATQLGGATDLSDTVKGVRFLLQPTSPGEYEFNVNVRPGTAFVTSPFGVNGELYDNGSQDDPDDPIVDDFFATAYVEVRLDGRVVMQGFGNEFSDYLIGPVYYDEPIVYAEPQPRGDLNATAALFTVGIGSIYHPLPVGEHTLEITVDSLYFGMFHTVHHITVSPK